MNLDFEILNNTGADLGFLEDLIREFMPFAQERHGFERPPKLFLLGDEENAADPLGKTGGYNPESMEVAIYVSGRHPKDILRSISHELVHHHQNERGDLSDVISTALGYAQEDPHMREMEREAYEQGNLCFRDFEDDRKKKINLKQLGESIYYTKPILLEGGKEMSKKIKEPVKDWKNTEMNYRLMKKFGLMQEVAVIDAGTDQAFHEETTDEHVVSEDTLEEDEEDAEDTKPSLSEKMKSNLMKAEKSLISERDFRFGPEELPELFKTIMYQPNMPVGAGSIEIITNPETGERESFRVGSNPFTIKIPEYLKTCFADEECRRELFESGELYQFEESKNTTSSKEFLNEASPSALRRAIEAAIKKMSTTGLTEKERQDKYSHMPAGATWALHNPGEYGGTTAAAKDLEKAKEWYKPWFAETADWKPPGLYSLSAKQQQEDRVSRKKPSTRDEYHAWAHKHDLPPYTEDLPWYHWKHLVPTGIQDPKNLGYHESSPGYFGQYDDWRGDIPFDITDETIIDALAIGGLGKMVAKFGKGAIKKLLEPKKWKRLADVADDIPVPKPEKPPTPGWIEKRMPGAAGDAARAVTDDTAEALARHDLTSFAPEVAKPSLARRTGDALRQGLNLGVEKSPDEVKGLARFLGKKPLTPDELKKLAIPLGREVNLAKRFGHGLRGMTSRSPLTKWAHEYPIGRTAIATILAGTGLAKTWDYYQDIPMIQAQQGKDYPSNVPLQVDPATGKAYAYYIPRDLQVEVGPTGFDIFLDTYLPVIQGRHPGRGYYPGSPSKEVKQRFGAMLPSDPDEIARMYSFNNMVKVETKAGKKARELIWMLTHKTKKIGTGKAGKEILTTERSWIDLNRDEQETVVGYMRSTMLPYYMEQTLQKKLGSETSFEYGRISPGTKRFFEKEDEEQLYIDDKDGNQTPLKDDKGNLVTVKMPTLGIKGDFSDEKKQTIQLALLGFGGLPAIGGKSNNEIISTALTQRMPGKWIAKQLPVIVFPESLARRFPAGEGGNSLPWYEWSLWVGTQLASYASFGTYTPEGEEAPFERPFTGYDPEALRYFYQPIKGEEGPITAPRTPRTVKELEQLIDISEPATSMKQDVGQPLRDLLPPTGLEPEWKVPYNWDQRRSQEDVTKPEPPTTPSTEKTIKIDKKGQVKKPTVRRKRRRTPKRARGQKRRWEAYDKRNDRYPFSFEE